MKRNTKDGFYTLEAAIFLPLVILAVLSLGYFIKVEGVWENCVHGALDESSRSASRAYGGSRAVSAKARIEDRIKMDNPQLHSVQVKEYRHLYSDNGLSSITSYRVEAVMALNLPLGFSREFRLDTGIKYRGFIGKKDEGIPLGADELSRMQAEEPVWIFPKSGEKYHNETCTYVKASVRQEVLTAFLKTKYDSCGLCISDEIPAGSIVFCFRGEGTAYHRGSCPSIKRHTSVMDQTEAEKKGYLPCSKCGG